jgi:hypothetical protein
VLVGLGAIFKDGTPRSVQCQVQKIRRAKYGDSNQKYVLRTSDCREKGVDSLIQTHYSHARTLLFVHRVLYHNQNRHKNLPTFPYQVIVYADFTRTVLEQRKTSGLFQARALLIEYSSKIEPRFADAPLQSLSNQISSPQFLIPIFSNQIHPLSPFIIYHRPSQIRDGATQTNGIPPLLIPPQGNSTEHNRLRSPNCR